MKPNSRTEQRLARQAFTVVAEVNGLDGYETNDIIPPATLLLAQMVAANFPAYEKTLDYTL